jgi:hypothetical protein
MVAAAIGSAVLAPSAIAQGQGQEQQGPPGGQRMDPRQMIDQRMATLTDKLQLTSAQQTKIRSILSDETMQMEALRKNAGNQRGGGGGGMGRRGGGGGPRPNRTGSDSTQNGEGRGRGGTPPEIVALRDHTDKQIEAVLNERQLATYRLLRAQQQQERERRDSESRVGRSS